MPSRPAQPERQARPTEHAPEPWSGRDTSIAAGVTLGFFVLYLLTLCRTVFWYDSAEYVAASYTLGIPHPPGAPLYTLIGHVFTWLPFDPALSVNLMSAVFGALGTGLTYGVCRAAGLSRTGATVGAATLGAISVYWAQAVIAELYTPTISFLMGVLWLVLHGLERDRSGPMVLAAALAGLALGIHMSIATVGLGLALLVLGIGLKVETIGDLRRVVSGEQLRRRLGVAARALGAGVLGACIFLYIPFRASMDPALNFFVTLSAPADWSQLDIYTWYLTGGTYKKLFLDTYSLGERSRLVFGSFYYEFAVPGLLLAVAGLARLARYRPLVGLAFLLMVSGNIYFFFNYYVHDLPVFFLPGMAVICCLVGSGADAVVVVLRQRLNQDWQDLAGRVASVLLLVFPLWLIGANYSTLDLSSFTEAERYGQRLTEQLPEGAALLTFTTPPEWVKSSVFVDYFLKVRRVRPDVQVYSIPNVPTLKRLMREGTPTYFFARPGGWTAYFEMEVEGELLRVVRLREQ